MKPLQTNSRLTSLKAGGVDAFERKIEQMKHGLAKPKKENLSGSKF